MEVLTCSVCAVAVHRGCHGGQPEWSSKWRCTRCEAGAREARCSLCPCRGGLLKPAATLHTTTATNSTDWVHVVCALWMPEVSFGDTEKLEPVEGVSAIDPYRRRLRCRVCVQAFNAECDAARASGDPAAISHARLRTFVPRGACIQCTRGNCSTPFHPLCGQRAGYRMALSGPQHQVEAWCGRCTERSLKKEAERIPLTVGQQVMARCKGTFYQGVIDGFKVERKCCSVRFDVDGSVSNDLSLGYLYFPAKDKTCAAGCSGGGDGGGGDGSCGGEHDLQTATESAELVAKSWPSSTTTCEFPVKAPPHYEWSPGERTTVLWTDGLFYTGLFLGYQTRHVYSITFDDGLTSTFSRGELRPLDKEEEEAAAAAAAAAAAVSM